MEFTFLKELISGSGFAHSLFVGLGLFFMVVAVFIWVLEFSGHTISKKGIVKNGMQWNSTTVAIIALSAAIYIVGRPIQFQFIPGVGGFNPTLALAPILGALFGLPAAIGVTFSMPIGDAISGALTIGSLAGMLAHTFLTWLPYKMLKSANFKEPKNIFNFYLWGIIIAPLIQNTIIPGWLDFTNQLPPAVAWGGVTASIFINHTLTAGIVSAILMPILYPIVKKRGMLWQDRITVWDDSKEE